MTAATLTGSLLRLAVAVGAMASLAGCAAADASDASSSEQNLDNAPCPENASMIAAAKTVAAQALACETAPPATPAAAHPWLHVVSSLLLSLDPPNHRGRDAIYAEGDDQWVLGKFAYGLTDDIAKGAAVEIYVQRECAGGWERLLTPGTVSTTEPGQHPTVEGVEDTGGRVYARIPAAQKLGIGHHRVRMVIASDRSYADQTIEVLPKGMPIFVSDVDGTLTERKPTDTQYACDEESDFPALWRVFLSGQREQPNVHVGAPAAYKALVDHGYRPFYLTARPEWLVPHTHDFMSQAVRKDGRGNLPLGIVHTTLGVTGAFDKAAETFKRNEVAMLIAKGMKPVFGFGNRPSDVATYDAYGLEYRFYFENKDTSERSCSTILDQPLLPAGDIAKGDWRIQSYTSVVDRFTARALICK